MATESTKDALIDLNSVPASEQANLTVTEIPNGTVVTNTGTTTGLVTFVEGTTQFVGGTLTDARFVFGGGTAPSLGFSNTNLQGSSFEGTNSNDFLGFGNNPLAKGKGKTVVSGSNATLGDGSDSVNFAKKSVVKFSTFATGQGADSVTFAKGSKNESVTVDLGQGDGAADVVDVNKKSAKNLEITNFGQEDVLRVGKKTYSYDDLQELGGRVNKNIQVDFS